MAECDRFANMREKLELVFQIFRGEQRAVRELAHILRPVDDLQVAIGIEKPGIARADPTIGGLGLGRRLIVLVIGDENAGALEMDFAIVRDLDLDLRRRSADRIRLDLAIRLQGDEHARFRRSVELFQVDADRAVEIEDVRTDRLSRRVGHAHPRHAKRILQWPIDEDLSQPVFDPIDERDGLAVQDRIADATGDLHEGLEQPALGGARVFHANHHGGQQILEDPWRRKEIGRPDLAQVVHDRRPALRAVHTEPDGQRLGEGEQIVADPCHRQICEHILVGR